VNITLSLCIVSFNDVDEELRGVMSNRTMFPVVGFYTTASLSRVRAIQQQFDMYGNCYMFKESLIPHIYVQYMRDLYVRYRDVIIPVYNVPRVLVVVETLRPPKVRVNETPVMSFLDAKYYLVIYEGVYRLACANFYTRELPIIGMLVENKTFAIVFKHFVVRGDSLPIHRSITVLHVVTGNVTAVLQIMKYVYEQLLSGQAPPHETVTKVIESVVDFVRPNASLEVIDSIIQNDFSDGWSYGIFGTPGFVVWNREMGRGVVIVGYAQA
jgi:hypothetical protein